MKIRPVGAYSWSSCKAPIIIFRF